MLAASVNSFKIFIFIFYSNSVSYLLAIWDVRLRPVVSFIFYDANIPLSTTLVCIGLHLLISFLPYLI
jgi:hypothetical protein